MFKLVLNFAVIKCIIVNGAIKVLETSDIKRTKLNFYGIVSSTLVVFSLTVTI